MRPKEKILFRYETNKQTRFDRFFCFHTKFEFGSESYNLFVKSKNETTNSPIHEFFDVTNRSLRYLSESVSVKFSALLTSFLISIFTEPWFLKLFNRK
jgi:hypothetical protein